ncbi:MAG: hypothetical protein ACFE95_22450 [Candidatus Hodarchaeota archaeon]
MIPYFEMTLVTHNVEAFRFVNVPLNFEKSSIKVFRNAKDTFSLEYSIFEPKTVNITMYPVVKGRSRKIGFERGLATIKQFASSLGLHPDFHKIGPARIRIVLDLLRESFSIDPEDPECPTYYCGGILGINSREQSSINATESFIDDVLEILTEAPQFAFVQFIFRSIKLPKEFRGIKERNKKQLPQVKFDIQQGEVELRFNPFQTNFLEETGCFEFTPRILVVETNQESLQAKIEQLSVIFESNGFNVQIYPTFFRRFSYFKKMCMKRKIVSPIILDGYSLMNFIAPPQRQFSQKGYTFVPNKTEYIQLKNKNKN